MFSGFTLFMQRKKIIGGMRIVTWKDKLGGGDLRSIGQADSIVDQIHSQDEFDSLFACLYDNDRLIVMRASDAIEKITIAHPAYLLRHKEEVLRFCQSTINIEFKWHLALLLARLPFTEDEQPMVFEILKRWALNPKESKIVRANALQSLSQLSKQNEAFKEGFSSIIRIVEKEDVPSLNARIRKLKR